MTGYRESDGHRICLPLFLYFCLLYTSLFYFRCFCAKKLHEQTSSEWSVSLWCLIYCVICKSTESLCDPMSSENWRAKIVSGTSRRYTLCLNNKIVRRSVSGRRWWLFSQMTKEHDWLQHFPSRLGHCSSWSWPSEHEDLIWVMKPYVSMMHHKNRHQTGCSFSCPKHKTWKDRFWMTPRISCPGNRWCRRYRHQKPSRNS